VSAALQAPEAGAQALLREHPWPADLADLPRLEWCWPIDVDMDREALWPLIADVSRLNRSLGNPEMQFTEKDGLRYGRARYAGILHEWHEVPWSWVAGRWFTNLRVYSRGSMRALYAIHELEALGPGRTRVQAYFGLIPRWRLLTPALRMSFASMGKQYARVLKALAVPPADSANVAARPPVLVSPPSPPLRPEAIARIA
jgi:hypothetical protein